MSSNSAMKEVTPVKLRHGVNRKVLKYVVMVNNSISSVFEVAMNLYTERSLTVYTAFEMATMVLSEHNRFVSSSAW